MGSARAVVAGLAIVMLGLPGAGCTKAIRMQARYDDEPLSSKPSREPTPTPPADIFEWGGIDVVANVATGSGNDRNVLLVPSPQYLDSGKNRGFVLNAFSDGLTTSSQPGIRGGVTVTMSGSGRMVISIRSAQGPNIQGDPLSGYLFINTGTPSIGYMTTKDLKLMESNPALLNSTGLSPYASGQSVTLRWSIDQGSRTVVLEATPFAGTSKSASVTFEQVAADGVQNTPIQKLRLMIEMFEMSRDAQLRFDDFYVEEM